MMKKRHLLLASIFVGVLTPSISISQVLTSKEREDIVGSTISSCVTTQRKDPSSDILSDDQVRRYCSCWARTLIPKTYTQEKLLEVGRIMIDRGAEASLRVMLEGRDQYELANQCVSEAMELQ